MLKKVRVGGGWRRCNERGGDGRGRKAAEEEGREGREGEVVAAETVRGAAAAAAMAPAEGGGLGGRDSHLTHHRDGLR